MTTKTKPGKRPYMVSDELVDTFALAAFAREVAYRLERRGWELLAENADQTAQSIRDRRDETLSDVWAGLSVEERSMARAWATSLTNTNCWYIEYELGRALLDLAW